MRHRLEKYILKFALMPQTGSPGKASYRTFMNTRLVEPRRRHDWRRCNLSGFCNLGLDSLAILAIL